MSCLCGDPYCPSCGSFMGTLPDDEKKFQDWVSAVNSYIDSVYGISVHDLPDVPMREWWEDKLKPLAAARRAIRYADGLDP